MVQATNPLCQREQEESSRTRKKRRTVLKREGREKIPGRGSEKEREIWWRTSIPSFKEFTMSTVFVMDFLVSLFSFPSRFFTSPILDSAPLINAPAPWKDKPWFDKECRRLRSAVLNESKCNGQNQGNLHKHSSQQLPCPFYGSSTVMCAFYSGKNFDFKCHEFEFKLNVYTQSSTLTLDVKIHMR